MYSTGPLFLSVIWKEYMREMPSEAGRVRILMQDEYNRFSWSFFTHHRGNSWHGKDAHLIFWVGDKKSGMEILNNANIL
jgi:mannosyltransferase OCH1-like enzyme